MVHGSGFEIRRDGSGLMVLDLWLRVAALEWQLKPKGKHACKNVIKVPQWYVVQVSDTTMMPIAASLPGQELIKNGKLKIKVFLKPLPFLDSSFLILNF